MEKEQIAFWVALSDIRRRFPEWTITYEYGTRRRPGRVHAIHPRYRNGQWLHAESLVNLDYYLGVIEAHEQPWTSEGATTSPVVPMPRTPTMGTPSGVQLPVAV